MPRRLSPNEEEIQNYIGRAQQGLAGQSPKDQAAARSSDPRTARTGQRAMADRSYENARNQVAVDRESEQIAREQEATAKQVATEAAKAARQQEARDVRAGAAKGMETTTDVQTGRTTIKTNPDGSPAWQTGPVGDPYRAPDTVMETTVTTPQGQTYRPLSNPLVPDDGSAIAAPGTAEKSTTQNWQQDRRDAQGNVTPTPLPVTADAKTGQQTVEMKDPTGQMTPKLVGIDPATQERQNRVAVAKQKQANIDLSRNQIAQAKAIYGPQFEPIDKAFREAEAKWKPFTEDGIQSKTIGNISRWVRVNEKGFESPLSESEAAAYQRNKGQAKLQFDIAAKAYNEAKPRMDNIQAEEDRIRIEELKNDEEIIRAKSGLDMRDHVLELYSGKQDDALFDQLGIPKPRTTSQEPHDTPEALSRKLAAMDIEANRVKRDASTGAITPEEADAKTRLLAEWKGQTVEQAKAEATANLEAQGREIASRYIGSGIRSQELAGKTVGNYSGIKNTVNEMGSFITGNQNIPELTAETLRLSNRSIDAAIKRADDMAASPLYGEKTAAAVKSQLTRMKAELSKAGIAPEDQGRVIQDTAKAQAWTEQDEDMTRRLSTGDIVINPGRVFGNKDAIVSEINASDATPEAKRSAISRLDQMREKMAGMLFRQTVYSDEGFKDFGNQQFKAGNRDKADILDQWSRQQKDRGWLYKATDAVTEGVKTGSVGVVKTIVGTAGGLSALMGADGFAKTLGKTADDIGQVIQTERDSAQLRGMTGAYGITSDLTDTVAQMAPMIAGGTVAAGMKGLAATATRGMSVYGWAGAQGYESKLADAVNIAASQKGSKLTSEEVGDVLKNPRTQVAAFLNGAQTAMLAAALPKGSERVALGTKAGGMTVTDFLRAGGTRAIKDGTLKTELKAMGKTIFADATDEMLEEFTNQVFDGLISTTVLKQDMQLGDLLEQSFEAGGLGAVAGGALPQFAGGKTKADTHREMLAVLQSQSLAAPDERMVSTALAAIDPEAKRPDAKELQAARQLVGPDSTAIKSLEKLAAAHDAAMKAKDYTGAAKIEDDINRTFTEEQTRSAKDAADAVMLARELDGLEEQAGSAIWQATQELNAARASGDKQAIAQAEVALEEVRQQAPNVPLARAAVKLATGKDIGELTDSELRAVGYKPADNGTVSPMTPKELADAGLSKPLIRAGADGSAIILDEAIKQVAATSERAATRIQLGEQEAMAASQARAQSPTPQTNVGQQQTQAGGTAPQPVAQEVQPEVPQAQPSPAGMGQEVPGSGGTALAGTGEPGPVEQSVIPSNQTDMGNPISETEPATDQTADPFEPTAEDAASIEKRMQAEAVADEVVSRVEKSIPGIRGRIQIAEEQGDMPSGGAYADSSGRIVLPLPDIEAELDRNGGDIEALADTLERYVSTHEVVHLIQYSTVEAAWKEAGSLGTFGQFFGEWYGRMHGELGQGVMDAAAKIYGQEAWNRISDAAKAAEVVRMLVESRINPDAADVSELFREVRKANSPTLIETIKRAITMLKDLLAKGELPEAVKDHVAQIEALYRELTSESPAQAAEPTGTATEGTAPAEGNGGGAPSSTVSNSAETSDTPAEASTPEPVEPTPEKPAKPRRQIDSPARREAFAIINSGDYKTITKLYGEVGKITPLPPNIALIKKKRDDKKKLTESERKTFDTFDSQYNGIVFKSHFPDTKNGKVAREVLGLIMAPQKGGLSPSVAAQGVNESWTPDQLWQSIRTELGRIAKGRATGNPMDIENPTAEDIARAEAQNAALMDESDIEQQQAENFDAANTADNGGKPISMEDFTPEMVGQFITVDGERMKVAAVEWNSFLDMPQSVTLQDGTRFGRQVLEDGEVVYVEDERPAAPAKTTKPVPTEPLALGNAPSVGRGKPRNLVEFKNPITGPSGAKLSAYQWQYRLEEGVDKRGEDSAVRVSDWEKSATNQETGREVVHQFHVDTPDGKGQVVSLESALQLLGYTEKNSASTGRIKSLASALKTRAKNLMELDRLEAENAVFQEWQKRYDFAFSRVDMAKMPPLTSEYKEPIRTWKRGDYQETRFGAWMKDPKPEDVTRIAHETANGWKEAEAIKEVGKSPKTTSDIGAKIKDLKRRIKLLDAKIENDTKAEVSAAAPQSAMDRKNSDSKQLFADDGGFQLAAQSTQDGDKIAADKKAKEEAQAAQDAAQTKLFASPSRRDTSTPDLFAAAQAPDAKAKLGDVKVGKVHALNAYRALTAKKAKVGLNAAEEQQLLDVEQALGQKLAFDMEGVRGEAPAVVKESSTTQPAPKAISGSIGGQQDLLMGGETLKGGQMTLFSSPTPEQDRAYLAAVEAGDMETAQRMVDEAAKKAGYDRKAYHGTPVAGFTVFAERPTYFADDKEMKRLGLDARAAADVFQSSSASSIRSSKLPDTGSPKTLTVYLRTTRLFDTRKPANRRQFNEQFLNQGGEEWSSNGTPLTSRQLPDWTDGRDLVDWIQETRQPYDALILDEGSLPQMDGSVKWRGPSIVVWNPSQIKLADPVTYDASGNVIPLSQRFNPASDSILYSSPSGGKRVDPLLAEIKKLITEPEKKAETFARMNNLVNGVRRRFDSNRLKKEFTAKGIDAARYTQIRDVAILEAAAKALPPEIRGKLIGSFRRLEELKTERGREQYLLKMLPKIEQALEKHLQKLYRKDIRKWVDRSKPQKNDSRNLRGKIGGIGHAVSREAVEAMTRTAEQADAIALAYREQIEEAETMDIEEMDELEGKAIANELFHDYENAGSARLEKALEFLKDAYQAGREEWIGELTARKEQREADIETLRETLGAPDFITEQMLEEARNAASGIARKTGDSILHWVSSAYQFFDTLKEKTSDPKAIAWVDSQQQKLMDARGAYDDALEGDRLALEQAMERIFKTKAGWAGKFQLDPILHDLSHRVDDHGVTVLEGVSREEIPVPITVAEALVRREVSGYDHAGKRYEITAQDLPALEEAWEKFNDLPEEAQAKKRVIRFDRVNSTGKRNSMGKKSQLEGLKEWLGMRQPDLFDKYEARGWDTTTLEELDRWLKPEVKELGLWMVDHLQSQQRELDQKHRSEFGIGMDLVENYFPALFESDKDTDSNVTPDGNNVVTRPKGASALKSRVAHRARPKPMNALSVFLSNRAQIHFFMTHATPLRELMSVFRSMPARNAMRVTLGDNFAKALVDELQIIEANGQTAAQGVLEAEKLIRKFMSGYALGVLGLKLSTLAINTTAVLNTALGVPVGKLLKGLHPEYIKDVRSFFNTPAILRRLHHGSSHEIRLASQGGIGGHPVAAGSRRIAQGSMQGLNWWDTFSNSLLGALAYRSKLEEARKAGLPEKEARRQADAEIDRLSTTVMQPNNLLSRSVGEVRLTSNPMGQLLFMFATEQRKNFAIGLYALRKVTTGKGAVSYGMAAQQLVTLGLFYSALGYLIRSAYQAAFNAEDDEPEEFAERFGKRMGDAKQWTYALSTEHLKGVPLIGEAMARFAASTVNAAPIPGEKVRVMESSPNPINKMVAGAWKSAEQLGEKQTPEQRAETTISLIQSATNLTPETALVSQLGNVAKDALGLLTSNGMELSDEEKFRRMKKRLTGFMTEWTKQNGKVGDDMMLREKRNAEIGEFVKDQLRTLQPAAKKAYFEAIQKKMSQDVQEMVSP